jgi:hypothetical protein
MQQRGGRVKKHMDETTEEYGFEYLCVGIVDIFHLDTVTVSIAQKYRKLPYVTKKVCLYYSIFINTMDAIAGNFGAGVKNVSYSDTVIFFFPKTSKPSSDKTPFKDILNVVLQCRQHMTT